MVIRRETSADRSEIDAVVSAAFGRADSDELPAETALVRALRRDVGWIDALSLVATDDDRIVGHVLCTRGSVGETSALGLGPIGVQPDYQRRGVGQALMHTIIGAADALGEPLIALLGDQRFYRRFGFVEASQLGVAAPDPEWGAHFQVRTLSGYRSPTPGTFRYAAPFGDL